MFSKWAKLRSRALSFSSSTGADDLDDIQEDLNALETVLNKEDLQIVCKPSPSKQSTPGNSKRRRRKSTSFHDPIVAIQDDRVYETGCQELHTLTENPDVLTCSVNKNRNDVREYNFKQNNGRVIIRKCNDDSSVNIMSDINRLIREQPIVLPTCEIKTIEDVDEYMKIIRSRKERREKQRKEILAKTDHKLARTELSWLDIYQNNNNQNMDDEEAEISTIKILPSDQKKESIGNNHFKKFVSRMKNHFKNSTSNSKSDNTLKATESRVQLRANLQHKIQKQQDERLDKKRKTIESSERITPNEIDNFLSTLGNENKEQDGIISDICSIISDTKTCEAVESAFEALKNLGTDNNEGQDLVRSFSDQWTIQSLSDKMLEESNEIEMVTNPNDAEELLDNKENKENVENKADYILGWINQQRSLNSSQSCDVPARISQNISETEKSLIKSCEQNITMEEDDIQMSKSDSIPSSDTSNLRGLCISSDNSDDEEVVNKQTDKISNDSIREESTRSEKISKHSQDSLSCSSDDEYREYLRIPKLANDFIEDQAEISGSDISADEADDDSLDGDNLDIIDNTVDDEIFENEISEINKIHVMREIADDSERVKALRERYLSKLQPSRKRNFHWDDNMDDLRFSEQYDSSDTSSESSEGSLLPTDLNISQSPIKIGSTKYFENSIDRLLNEKNFKSAAEADNGNSTLVDNQRSQFLKNMACNLTNLSKFNITENDCFQFDFVHDENANDGLSENKDSVFTHFSK